MKRRLLYGFAIVCLLASQAHAQFRSNLVKVNLTGIPLKNYSLQFEGVLTRRISFAVSYRTMPATTLPFKNEILKAVNSGDSTARKTIQNFELSNIAITPEVRIYLGKGNGRGFYIAPFYRYAHYKTNALSFDYEGTGASGTITLSGTLTSNTVGLLFGRQWLIGKRVVLDWWIFGPQYGSGKGDFEGRSSQALTQEEQDDLRQKLNDIDIPLTKKTVNVTANSASLKLSGPWGGVRSGISLGVRF